MSDQNPNLVKITSNPKWAKATRASKIKALNAYADAFEVFDNQESRDRYMQDLIGRYVGEPEGSKKKLRTSLLQLLRRALQKLLTRKNRRVKTL